MEKIEMEKRKRICNSKHEPGVEDRIGQLPDDVLGFIIGYLTLKEAGRTCALSRRWESLWTLNNRFNFDASERTRPLMDNMDSTGPNRRGPATESEREGYIRWVSQVVDKHRGSDLDELVIVFDLDESHSCHLDKWISFALKKRVKAIKINLDPFFARKLKPYSFLSSAPALSGVECLTSLWLDNVSVTGGLVEQLLSVCPILERLSLRSARYVTNLRLIGSSLKLKYLEICHCFSLKSVEIFAPNLLSLNFQDLRPPMQTELQVEGLCCLVELDLGATVVKYDFLALSSYFIRLESLTLSTVFCEMFLEMLEGLPQFTNLKRLTLEIQLFLHYYINGLLEFINLCPLVDKFTLKLPTSKDEVKYKINWRKLRPHKSLKAVEIVSFGGYKHEFEIAECFLKRAIRLQQLTIDTGYRYWHCNFRADEEVVPGSRERAQLLKTNMPPGVELLII